MISKIVAIVWIISGMICLFKPQILKNRLTKKMNRKFKFIMFGFMLFLGLSLIGSVFSTPGFIAKIILVLGLILAIKAIIFVTSKTSDKLLDWLSKKPILSFRIWALVVLSTGIILFFA